MDRRYPRCAEPGYGLRAQRRAVAAGCGGGVAWGAAICIMPWEFYLHYGDRDMLARNLDGMKGYVDYLGGWADADGVIYARAPHRPRTGLLDEPG